MESIFENYPEQSASVVKTKKKCTEHPVLTKREIKVLKKFAKQLKKYYKCQKQAEEHHVEEKKENDNKENTTYEKNTANCSKEESQSKGNRDEKTFWNKLGDAFLKVFPKIICTVVSTVITAVFTRNFKWRMNTA